jgi:cysteinyl-tRNA synthetase
VIRRYLEYSKFKVTFVVNFTDVDDKIIARARRLKAPIGELTEKFIQEYYNDMGALGVRRADVEPRATRHIPEMLEMIQELIEKGIAYQAGANVYYDISKFSGYGKLSHRNIDELEAGTRIEPGEGKRNPLDFALWKAAKENEPEWESPWGPGRPGWHIECSAMSSRYLGRQFDIHAGGEDLIFPHHENEIAQSEGCFGHDWVRYWMHNGFVRINHEKMSKSKGNFFTIKAILEDHPAEVVRYFLLGTHYRHPVDFSDMVMKEARKGLDRLYNARLRLEMTRPGDDAGLRGEMEAAAEAYRRAFAEAMDDDFNTAKAMGHLFDFARRANAVCLKAGGPLPERAARPGREVFGEMAGVLGFFQLAPEEWFRLPQAGPPSARPEDGPAGGADAAGLDGAFSEEAVEKLIVERGEARSRKDFAEADRIRNDLVEAGILLEDGPSGTIWKRKV